MSGITIDSLEGLGFFSLCERIESAFPDSPPIGSTRDPRGERVRFRANPALGFSGGDIEGFRILRQDPVQIEVTVNFLGLHGPASPLPPHYTERVMHADEPSALGAFFDFFNHRLVGLYYQCWINQRYEIRYRPGASDSMSDSIAAFIGLFERNPEDAGRERVLLLPYAGLLALFSRSRTVISGVLSQHFGIPCELEEFVRRDISIPPEARCRLGRLGTLGVDAIAGETMPDVTGRFLVRIGPLTAGQYRSFLPGRPARDVLARLLDLMVREPLDWGTSLVLAQGEADGGRLGTAELGWTSFLDPPGDKNIMVEL